MYVIYHSSDSFAEVTGVSMLSLFENNKHINNIHVLYIERNLSEENRSKLISIAEKYNRTIEFMEMPDWSKKLDINLKSCKAGWVGFGYNRLFLTEYIPDNIDRILYLDSDTIIEGPLDDLWNIDFKDAYLAAVDDCLSRFYRPLVGISKNGVYCNSGVLLVNLKKWREDNIQKRFIDMIYQNNGYFVFNEQSILNTVFDSKILVLPQQYNVNSLIYLFTYKELMNLRRPYHFSYTPAEFEKAKVNPVITHYTGNFFVRYRPWERGSDHPHKDSYLKYREISPWRMLPLRLRAKKNDFWENLCHVLPRSTMILCVSILYNVFRPIRFWWKIKEERK